MSKCYEGRDVCSQKIGQGGKIEVSDRLSLSIASIYPNKQTNKQTLILHRTVVIQGQNPHFWYLVTKSRLIQFLWNPTDCSPLGSSVHGISQARILECVPFPSLGDLPDPGMQSVSLALAGRFFITEPPGKPQSPPYLGTFGNVWSSVWLSQLREEYYSHLQAEVRGGPEHLTTHKRVPTTKNFLVQNINSAEVKKPSHRINQTG